MSYKVCRNCGGPIYSHNKYGYCRRNKECAYLGTRASLLAKHPQAKCKNCGRVIQGNNVTGYCSVNPECNREREKIKNAARHASGKVAQWRARNRDSQMLASARTRAKEAGVPCTITRQDIQDVWTDKCPIFGYELKSNHDGTHSHQRESHSLDRINPAKGYVPGNIQILSQRANAMKSDATPEELLQFADWIYKTYGSHQEVTAS